MPAEAIRINRRVLLQCSIGAPGLKQPFAQPQQNGALSAQATSTVISTPFTVRRSEWRERALIDHVELEASCNNSIAFVQGRDRSRQYKGPQVCRSK